jgi:hypothetical protein
VLKAFLFRLHGCSLRNCLQKTRQALFYFIAFVNPALHGGLESLGLLAFFQGCPLRRLDNPLFIPEDIENRYKTHGDGIFLF